MRILFVITELYWIWQITSGIIKKGGFPANPVLWTATGIEIILGFLTYIAFKRTITSGSPRLWNFISLFLFIIGIGAPIILYYSSIDFLKPAGGTWMIYMLTINSLYLYRVLRKQPMSRGDLPSGRLFKTIKILYWIFSSIIVIIIIVLALLPAFGFVPLYSAGEPRLNMLGIIFIIFSILTLAIGWYSPRIVGSFSKSSRSDMFVYFLFSIRMSFFVTVAFLGLIVGIFGASWFIWLPLTILAGVAMALTYPTEKRWIECHNEQPDNIEYSQ